MGRRTVQIVDDRGQFTFTGDAIDVVWTAMVKREGKYSEHAVKLDGMLRIKVKNRCEQLARRILGKRVPNPETNFENYYRWRAMYDIEIDYIIKTLSSEFKIELKKESDVVLSWEGRAMKREREEKHKLDTKGTGGWFRTEYVDSKAHCHRVCFCWNRKKNDWGWWLVSAYITTPSKGEHKIIGAKRSKKAACALANRLLRDERKKKPHKRSY